MSLLLSLLLAADPAVIVPARQSPPRRVYCSDDCISPVEAVTYASYLAPKAGIAGTFRMDVKAVGEREGIYYLDSETDYRDRNCLTIAVPAAVMAKLAQGEGLAAVEKRFKGRTIMVRGVAQRVRIGFFDAAGKPTDKYYYQVQVRIGRSEQIATRGGLINDKELSRTP